MDKLNESRRELFEKLEGMKAKAPIKESRLTAAKVALSCGILILGFALVYFLSPTTGASATQQQGIFNTVIDGKGHRVEVLNAAK